MRKYGRILASRSRGRNTSKLIRKRLSMNRSRTKTIVTIFKSGSKPFVAVPDNFPNKGMLSSALTEMMVSMVNKYCRTLDKRGIPFVLQVDRTGWLLVKKEKTQ